MGCQGCGQGKCYAAEDFWSSMSCMELKFFEFITKPIGIYMCSDDDTREQTTMDVARILLRTKFSLVLNEAFNVNINGNMFNFKVVMDPHEPLRICLPLGLENNLYSPKPNTFSDEWISKEIKRSDTEETDNDNLDDTRVGEADFGNNKKLKGDLVTFTKLAGEKATIRKRRDIQS